MKILALLAATAAALSAPVRRPSGRARAAGRAVHQALRSRRTINNFDQSKPVSDEIMRRALEAAIQAPNHKLTEPWLFRRLGRESIEAVATLNAASIADPEKAAKKAARWASIDNWLVVTSKITPGDELLTLEDYAATCCAVQNLQLAFAADGVGTKWTSGDIQRTPEFEAICGIEAGKERVVGVVWYGYADGAAPPPKKRKLAVDDVLVEVA